MLKETDMRTAVLAALDGTASYVMRFENDLVYTSRVGNCRLDYLTNEGYTFKFLIDEPEEPFKGMTPEETAESAEKFWSDIEIIPAKTEEPEELPFTPDKSELESFEPVEIKHKGGRYPKVDVGKLMALHNAGWDDAKIADELNVNIKTVRRYLREEGAKDD